jgi:acetyl-CoA carboxylase biotin carboxylase subunit
MAAKVIVHAPTRLEAIRRMRRVLGELVIDGIKTNQTIQFYILHQPDYIKGRFNTSFIEKHLEEMVTDNG